jgi:hypothetical protein
MGRRSGLIEEVIKMIGRRIGGREGGKHGNERFLAEVPACSTPFTFSMLAFFKSALTRAPCDAGCCIRVPPSR